MAGRNQFRIIGGEWRGRRMPFPNVPGLRPTADAVRETLFNWLQTRIEGSRCLDLFAGSGALGIEALSRGASDVIFVERARPAATGLKAGLEALRAGERARVLQSSALSLLQRGAEPRDLVFLDPPFESDIIGRCCRLLAERGWLAPGALVYAEVDRQRGLPELPAGWSVIRQGQSGRVGYHLIATEDQKD
ncbi:16S rRNA (guanine(966)-N(2))-methyltransferase RsmD [Ectothiorhodospiraceae bacterium WFHF3C12]|nr:16S rRNA (guanine(966)-N(2))-methyltransferase RsmD [Ectothiorhodospiraceae bacterium WFHF3C12]